MTRHVPASSPRGTLFYFRGSLFERGEVDSIIGLFDLHHCRFIVVNMMVGSVIIAHCHRDDRHCHNGKCDHHTVDDVTVMIIGRCDDGRCDDWSMRGRCDDHNGGDHIIGHSDDGPGDNHKCDGDLCGW